MEGITEDEIQRYLYLLDQLRSNDNQVRFDAESEINETGSKDIIKSIFIFTSIILRDGISFPLVYLSLVWIKKIFTPIPPATDDDIAQVWFKVDKSDREKVKLALIRGLMFPEPQIALITALTFSALLNIEKMEMFDLIRRLYQLYESSEYSELTKAATINVLAEISTKNSLGAHTDTAEVQKILLEIFEKVGSYFTDCLDKSLDIRFSIANVIDIFLDVADTLFQPLDVTDSLIDIVLENLAHIPDTATNKSYTQPDRFHSTLLSILLKIIKLHYSNEEFNPDKIFEFINQKIIDYQDPSVDQDMISNYLIFWTSLADYERKIVKNNVLKDNLGNYNKLNLSLNYIPPKEIYRDFCSTAIHRLTDKLLKIMNMIDPKDPDAEDVNNKMPHMFATCCLQSFFKLNPEDIFLRIKECWKPEMSAYFQQFYQKKKENKDSSFIIPPLNWINDHTLLLTISIICRKTIIHDQIINLLQDFFMEPHFDGDFIILRDYILGTCLHAFDIPKIVDTCLFSLSLLFERYPTFLNLTCIDIIIDWTRENMRIGDPIIFSRIVLLLAVITSKKISPAINIIVKKRILKNFDVFCELYMVGVAREDSISSDIYRISYGMICNAVCFSIHSQAVIQDIDNTDNIARLIQHQLSILNDTSEHKEYSYTRISSAMFFFNSLFNTEPKYHMIYDTYINQIVDAYSKIMKPDSPIFEEGLMALDIIIQCYNETGTDLYIKVNELINAGFSSDNLSIIANSAYVCASLYNKYISNKLPGYEELLEKFESRYEMIVEGCLCNDKFNREYYPILLKAVALIIKACLNYIQTQNPGIIDSFIEQYEHFTKMPIYIENNEDLSDIIYADRFYDAMFTFATSILKCITKENRLSQDRKFMRFIMNTIPEAYFKNLEFNFSSNSLISFYEFLKQFIITFRYKGNNIINRKTNYKIVFNGLASNDKNVRELSNDMLTKIKNA